MIKRLPLVTLLILYVAQIPTPAAAIDGETIITQAKAVQGGITPGDAPGFPITITQPGAYRFGSNITPPPDSDGIEVREADITIDLNGFRLHGLGRARNGISERGNIEDVHPSLTVRNGTIAGFQDHGVTGSSHSWIIENMRITVNGRVGININGRLARIVQSTITETGTGVHCHLFCHVESSLISGNGGFGIVMTSGSIISTSAIGNGSAGVSCGPGQCVSLNANIN